MSYASYSSLGKDPKAPPPESMAEIPRITSQDHRQHHISKYRVVVVDNYTDWCGPCKHVAPLFAQLAQKYQNMYQNQNQVVFVKENVEDNFGGGQTVRGVPCFHFYLEGSHIPELTVTGGNIENVKNNLNKLLNK
jgi:thioredoxin 1